MRKRTAVSLYVALTALAAAGCVAAALTRNAAPLTIDLVAFMILATLTDLREIKLPLVGDRHALVRARARLPDRPRAVAGAWLVAAVSAASPPPGSRATRVKIVFNVGNYVVSTFLAGLLYLALAPAAGAFMTKVLPTFAATIVDFVVNTALLAGVIAPGDRTRARCASGGRTTSGRLPGYLDRLHAGAAASPRSTCGSACRACCSPSRRCTSSTTPTTST